MSLPVCVCARVCLRAHVHAHERVYVCIRAFIRARVNCAYLCAPLCTCVRVTHMRAHVRVRACARAFVYGTATAVPSILTCKSLMYVRGPGISAPGLALAAAEQLKYHWRVISA